MSDTSRKRNKDKTNKDDDVGMEHEEKHCICEFRDYTTLMICCDYCSIWYHAKCMGLSKGEVDRIEKYACKKCQKENKKIIYIEVIQQKGAKKRKQSISVNKTEKKVKKEAKENKNEGEVMKVKKEKKEEESTIKKAKKNSTTSNPAEIQKKTENEPTLAIKQEIKNSPAPMIQVKIESTGSPSGIESAHQNIPPQILKQQKLQEENPKLRCSSCIGCFRDNDCGKCVICVQKDNGEKLCIQRICVQVEELFRRIQEKKVKKESPDSGEADEPQKSKKGRKPKNAATAGQSNNSFDQRKQRSGHGQFSGGKEDQNSIATQLNKYYCSWMKNRQKGGEKIITPKEFQERQCYGPDCDKTVRPGSNYCSEKCGLELAQLRLKAILPQRANIYFAQIPSSQQADRERIQELENQMRQFKDQLKQFENWKENVHLFLEALKNGAQPSGEKTRNEEEGLVFGCPVCAGEFPMREISKHIHSCYVRSEKQTTYGTDYKMQGDTYNLYCDQLNKINQTYCKRLRYACAEHYKDEYELKICGCPLNWFKKGGSMTFKDLFTASPEALLNEFCQEKSKNCRDHLNWIQTAFSLIDNEIMNLLNRMEEIGEQLRSTANTLRQRGDVLTLITSKTISSSSTSSTTLF